MKPYIEFHVSKILPRKRYNSKVRKKLYIYLQQRFPHCGTRTSGSTLCACWGLVKITTVRAEITKMVETNKENL